MLINNLEALKVEIDVLQKISHPFITRVEQVFVSEHRVYYLMDYYDSGDLSYFIRSHQRMDQNVVQFIACQIALALGELHSKKILYRDLKAENLLIGSDGYISLADFGISKIQDQSTTFVGTPIYIAPEMISGEV